MWFCALPFSHIYTDPAGRYGLCCVSKLFSTNINEIPLKEHFFSDYMKSIREFVGMISTFILTVFGWIFFRAKDLNQAWYIIQNIFTKDILKAPKLPGEANIVICAIYLMLIIAWFGRENNYALEKFGIHWHRSLRWLFYILIFLLCLILMGEEQEFIYFQF